MGKKSTANAYERERNKPSLELARDRFFRGIFILYPVVLEDLSMKPFQAFIQAIPEAWEPPVQGKVFESIYGTGFRSLFAGQELNPDASNLRNALLEWAAAYNLRDEWCIERALATLWHWRHNDEARKSLEWRYVYDWHFIHSEGGFALTEQDESNLSKKYWDSENGTVFGFRHWDPVSIEDRQFYEKQISKYFKQKLRNYLEEVEAIAQARGFVPKKKKDFPAKYYAMLIYYQVIGKDSKIVALTYSGSSCVKFEKLKTQSSQYPLPDQETQSAFNKATQRLSGFLGLTLRDAQGRRRL